MDISFIQTPELYFVKVKDYTCTRYVYRCMYDYVCMITQIRMCTKVSTCSTGLAFQSYPGTVPYVPVLEE